MWMYHTLKHLICVPPYCNCKWCSRDLFSCYQQWQCTYSRDMTYYSSFWQYLARFAALDQSIIFYPMKWKLDKIWDLGECTCSVWIGNNQFHLSVSYLTGLPILKMSWGSVRTKVDKIHHPSTFDYLVRHDYQKNQWKRIEVSISSPFQWTHAVLLGPFYDVIGER